ncbi:MAG: hypothetical protein GY835_04875 [bacterium]|nr:hypothetical protein [bacterium]
MRIPTNPTTHSDASTTIPTESEHPLFFHPFGKELALGDHVELGRDAQGGELATQRQIARVVEEDGGDGQRRRSAGFSPALSVLSQVCLGHRNLVAP